MLTASGLQVARNPPCSMGRVGSESSTSGSGPADRFSLTLQIKALEAAQVYFSLRVDLLGTRPAKAS